MGMITAERSPRRRNRTLVTGVVLLVAGVLGGTVAGGYAARELVGLEARELTVPVETSLSLTAREYAVYERVGSAARDTGGAGTDVDTPTTLTADLVTVTGPGGRALEVRPRGRVTEDLTVDGGVYVAFAYLTPPTAGTYTVRVAAPDGAPGTAADAGLVVVNPTLGSIARTALPWIGLGVLAGAVVVLGLVLTLVGAFRRPRTATTPGQPAWQQGWQQTTPAPGAGPQPGWYPDPGEQGTVRWWDGYRWTDQYR